MSPKRPKPGPGLHVVPKAPRLRRAARPPIDPVLVALGNAAIVAHRLDTLGRAQCTDLEVAARAQLEGWPVDPDAPGIVARLAIARLAGLADLRERLHAVALGQATAADGQAITSVWLSRQHLGHTPAGIDESTRRKVAKMQGLPRHELARALRQALAKLEGPTAPKAIAE